MNPLLSRLQPYPFERLRQLFSTVTPSAAHRPISLGIGEPRHATPTLVLDALAGATAELAAGGFIKEGWPTMAKNLPVWRSLLYVPTIQPKFIERAADREADAIILDL